MGGAQQCGGSTRAGSRRPLLAQGRVLGFILSGIEGIGGGLCQEVVSGHLEGSWGGHQRTRVLLVSGTLRKSGEMQ